ncbi:MAG TPA: AAA family ATPase [Rhodanobacteraceae bacterium]|nr:AAA family ATPase [Rhodanobacteraceae bacterium]
MSIVEKAAEKLRTQRPAEQPVSPQVEEVAEAHTAPTVERLQEQRHAVRREAADGEVVHIDLDALTRAGLLPTEDEASGRLSNEVRRAKLPLLNNATGKSVKVPEFADRIVVTSAVPGEGKTFTAINLALSLAREPDFEVLLLDADIPKSDVTRTFGLEGYPGLMDILVDETRRPADVILHTDVPNLFLVPAGHRNPLAAELFGGRRMGQVLEELGASSKQRLLVFDSSPLLATPEARVLASQMGQVVVVVGAGHTRRYELKSALEGLGGSQYIGLILNKSRLPAIENPYYGYYGQYGNTQPTNRDRLLGR